MHVKVSGIDRIDPSPPYTAGLLLAAWAQARLGARRTAQFGLALFILSSLLALVAQAAWQVGYKYPNNFTVAFTRYFGRSPKSIFGKKR